MPTRRDLLVQASLLGASALVASAPRRAQAADDAAGQIAITPGPAAPTGKPSTHFTLAPLPYSDADLAPALSQNAITFHYGKHHQGYINKLNEYYTGNEALGTTQKEVAKATYGNPDQIMLYNNAAQSWNHAFYWNSMKKKGGGTPGGALGDSFKSAFTDAEGFKNAFREVATSQFGSGWAWLVNNNGKLSILKTSNADSPQWAGGGTPLIVIDVWEHAYYLDYQNKRNEYVNAFCDSLVNWEFAAQNFAG